MPMASATAFIRFNVGFLLMTVPKLGTVMPTLTATSVIFMPRL